MPSVTYDLIYLRSALDSLESYLFSSEIFWNCTVRPPPGEPIYPALTLGGILFSHIRLKSRDMSRSEYADYHSISLQLEAIRSRWRTAWEKKASASYRARLTQWRNFLEDYRRNPNGNVDRYAYEVRLRVMLSLLDQDNPYIIPEQRELLAVLDEVLFARLAPGQFIWEEEYQNSFPENEYEYLYGHLVPDLEP